MTTGEPFLPPGQSPVEPRPSNIDENRAVPTSSWSLRPPSPPAINIPVALPSHSRLGVPRDGANPYHTEANHEQDHLVIKPSYENCDPDQLTSEDLDIITGKSVQTATDRAGDWSYNMRRQAQRILDFLYLGPMSVARDHDYLRQEGISMILVIQQKPAGAAAHPHRPLTVEKAARELGIRAAYIDLESPSLIMSCFRTANRAINDHLLSVYRDQAKGRTNLGEILVQPEEFRRARVLVTCETGNDRSPTFVAAYIMSIFGRPLVHAVQFISIQRFCAVFDEDAKRVLQSWEDILRAKSAVALQSREGLHERSSSDAPRSRSKRRMDEMRSDQGGDVATADFPMDEDRFLERVPFQPFVDGAPNMGH